LDEQLLGKQQSAQPTSPAPKVEPVIIPRQTREAAKERGVGTNDYHTVVKVLNERNREGWEAHWGESESAKGAMSLDAVREKVRRGLEKGTVLNVSRYLPRLCLLMIRPNIRMIIL
jgi:hypothetical protein